EHDPHVLARLVGNHDIHPTVGVYIAKVHTPERVEPAGNRLDRREVRRCIGGEEDIDLFTVRAGEDDVGLAVAVEGGAHHKGGSRRGIRGLGSDEIDARLAGARGQKRSGQSDDKRDAWSTHPTLRDGCFEWAGTRMFRGDATKLDSLLDL